MATADRQQDLYDAVLEQLRRLCRRPGITGAVLADDHCRILAGSGTRPAGDASTLGADCGRAIDSGRRLVNGSTPDGFCGQFHHTPGFRCHIQDLDRHLRLISFTTAELSPALVYRYVEPIAESLNRLMARLLDAAPESPAAPAASRGIAPETDPDTGAPAGPIWE